MKTRAALRPSVMSMERITCGQAWCVHCPHLSKHSNAFNCFLPPCLLSRFCGDIWTLGHLGFCALPHAICLGVCAWPLQCCTPFLGWDWPGGYEWFHGASFQKLLHREKWFWANLGESKSKPRVQKELAFTACAETVCHSIRGSKASYGLQSLPSDDGCGAGHK